MKKTILLIAAIFFLLNFSWAQRYCYVDSEYILGKIPAYKEAQKKIEELTKKYQDEIKAKKEEVDKLYKKYVEERPLLPEETRRKREDEIIKKEAEVKKLNMTYFGVEGELYKKRVELMKPIQDDFSNAVKKFAEDGHYDFIFDIVTGEILYANPKFDESDSILKLLNVE